MDSPQARRPTFLASFGRSQVASMTATVIDFGTLITLVEGFHVWYVLATAIGALLGAIASFSLGRSWAFQAQHGRVHGQAFRYALVSGTSLCLNTAGVYLFTEFGHLPYPVSKAVTAFVVGICFNFPLHRHFVFR